MKYGILIRQEGEGCGHMIGCGLRFVALDANDDADARVKAKAWLQRREGDDDVDGYLAGEWNEVTYESVSLVKIVDDELPIAEWRGELEDAAEQIKQARTDAAEEAELQRLLAKRRPR